MTRPPHTRIKSLLILLLVLASTLVAFHFSLVARAETKIVSVMPSSGYVGTTVRLRANISTDNGQYMLLFDGINITSGSATGYEVDELFNVTSVFIGDRTFAGGHNVTLVDVTAGENDTAIFTVLTEYSLETNVPGLPAQRQENDHIEISLNITGGESSRKLVANVTVQAPTNVSYTNLLNITTSNDGRGWATTKYPDDFPLDANTNFTGEYTVFLNGTVANETFTIGLTNSTEYHRLQPVDVKAAGYKPGENVTVAISFGKKMIHSKNITAQGGLIYYANWTIPSNASIGIYTVNITSISTLDTTIKNPPDIQDFTVPGFAINITTINLAKDPVPNVTVEVYENVTLVLNATSDSDGLVGAAFEIGNYACEAFFKGEKVGRLSLNIAKEASFDLDCNLTNLRILVKDESENSIPEVELDLAPENQTLITDINGTVIIPSLLPNVTYVLNATRYSEQFSSVTIPRLLVNETAIAWFNINITCPTLMLRVNVTDGGYLPLSNVIVKVHESMGGLHYEGETVDGTVTLNCTFGKYEVEVYTEGIRLNGTIIDLFENRSLFMKCEYYGLMIRVKVVDYFGQPIPNANVTLQREGMLPRSNTTGSDGSATFSDFIGGNTQISIYLDGQTQPCIEKTPSVESSTTIGIKIEKYVLMVGVLVETSHLITASIIAASILLILSIEVYRRKHSKLQEGSS